MVRTASKCCVSCVDMASADAASHNLWHVWITGIRVLDDPGPHSLICSENKRRNWLYGRTKNCLSKQEEPEAIIEYCR